MTDEITFDHLPKPHIENDEGYIYIIESDYGFKIGMATDYWTRFSEIKTGCPIELKLKRVFSVSNVVKTEKELHKLFSDKKIRGEWFNLNDEDVKIIENYLNYNHYLIRLIDVKNKKVIKPEKIYDSLFSTVEPKKFNTINEVYLKTEINNLRKENEKLRKEYNKLIIKLSTK